MPYTHLTENERYVISHLSASMILDMNPSETRNAVLRTRNRFLAFLVSTAPFHRPTVLRFPLKTNP